MPVVKSYGLPILVLITLVLANYWILYDPGKSLHSLHPLRETKSMYGGLHPISRSFEYGGGEVCKDVFEIGKISSHMSEFQQLVVEVIKRKKTRKLFIPNVFYEVAGYQAPHMIHRVANGTGLGGSNYTLSQERRLDQVKGQLTHLSCRLRGYGAEEVRDCLHRRPHTHLIYVGDSRIRQHVEVMLDLIRPLNPVLTTHKGQTITVGDFLGDKGMRQWKKYKHNFTVECPGLYVEFRWAPLLHLRASEKGGLQPEFKVGGWDFLQTLAEAEEDKMPDLLVLDTGAWQLHQRLETVLDQVDDASVYVMTKLRPLLARLAQRTTVVWTLPDPFKDYISHDYSRMSYFSHQTNTILEWVLNAQVSLPPPGIIKWDSFLPVAHAAVSDCVDMYVGNVSLDLLPAFNSFPSIMAWHCTERMHIGMEALSLAVQMTLNHICNPYMDGDYCCSSQDA